MASSSKSSPITKPSFRNATAAVDDGLVEARVASDLNLGEQHRLAGSRIRVNPAIGEQQREPDRGARNDAAARNHRIDRHAAAILVVEHKFCRRELLLLVGPKSASFRSRRLM